MIKFVDLYAQYLGIKADIDAAIEDVIRRSGFIGGEAVREFERAFADYQQATYCVGVANGTDAIEIALESLSLAPGSEVIVPANSFIASSEAVTRSGHRVVFADIDPETYTLDLADVERRITGRTAAIIAVHLHGHPCDMSGLRQLAGKFNLRVVEDCAQAHGAEYRGRRVGTLGDLATFSFFPAKNLGAFGDAGAILTNDESLAGRCRMIANHGRVSKYFHEFEGRNSRLDGLHAAILTAKLRHLGGWTDRRRAVAEVYFDGLRSIPGLTLPVVRDHVRHAFHLFVIRCEARDALAEFLAAREIETGIHYPVSLPKLPAYDYLGQAAEPMLANTFDGQVLSLPVGEHLSRDDAQTVVDAVREFFGGVISARAGSRASLTVEGQLR
jgi:dTDP-4-amino-4,6-dideoxygalactose transaminase